MLKSRAKKAICLVMAAALFCGIAIPAAAEQQATVESVEETVYGNIHPDGSYTLNTVYKLKVTSPGYYTIHGDFSSGKNLTADVDFNLDEAGVTLQFPRTFDEFFFQVENSIPASGVKGSNVGLPFFINYRVERADGSGTASKGGESGRMRLVVEVTANGNAPEYFRKRYVAQIQIPVRVDVFRNIKTEMSGVLTGKTYNYTGMVLPGMSETFTIEGDVESLELDSISVMMLDFDFSAITADNALLNGINEMKDGAAELSKGTRELGEGMDKLADGLTDLNRAVKSVRNGAGQFAESMAAFEEGFEELAAGSSELEEGAAGIAGGAAALSAQGEALVEGFSQIRMALTGSDTSAMITELAAGLQSLAKAIQESPTMSAPEKQRILAGLSELSAKLPSTEGQTDSEGGLASLLEEYEMGLRSYVGAVSMLSAGASALSDGTGRYISGVNALKDNFIKLSIGADELSQGLVALGVGHNEMTSKFSSVPEEVKKLADGQEALYEGIEKFRSTISEYVGEAEDNPVVSSLSSDNAVDHVQFIFRTDAIKTPKPEKVQQDIEKEKNFFDRLLDLFR